MPLSFAEVSVNSMRKVMERSSREDARFLGTRKDTSVQNKKAKASAEENVL